MCISLLSPYCYLLIILSPSPSPFQPRVRTPGSCAHTAGLLGVCGRFLFSVYVCAQASATAGTALKANWESY